MGINMKNGLGRKRKEGVRLPRLGVREKVVAASKTDSVSIFTAYNVEAEMQKSESTVHAARTIEAVLLRRVQALQ